MKPACDFWSIYYIDLTCLKSLLLSHADPARQNCLKLWQVDCIAASHASMTIDGGGGEQTSHTFGFTCQVECKLQVCEDTPYVDVLQFDITRNNLTFLASEEICPISFLPKLYFYGLQALYCQRKKKKSLSNLTAFVASQIAYHYSAAASLATLLSSDLHLASFACFTEFDIIVQKMMKKTQCACISFHLQATVPCHRAKKMHSQPQAAGLQVV